MNNPSNFCLRPPFLYSLSLSLSPFLFQPSSSQPLILPSSSSIFFPSLPSHHHFPSTTTLQPETVGFLSEICRIRRSCRNPAKSGEPVRFCWTGLVRVVRSGPVWFFKTDSVFSNWFSPVHLVRFFKTGSFFWTSLVRFVWPGPVL